MIEKRIPRLQTDQAAAVCWEKQSFADVAEDTTEAGIRFVKRPKRAIALRLDPDDIAKIETLAAAKGLNYTALLRMWIKEHLAA
jgi:predicted DNA binding CopG/RHH family protein